MKHLPIDRDMLAVIALSGLAIILALLVPPDWGPARLLALPLVLVLPGYAFVCALFPRQPSGIAERLVLSLGLSLALVALSGLLLNLTPFGLGTGSWAVFLGGITIAASLIALLRRRGQSRTVPVWFGGHMRFPMRQGLLLALAALTICGAVLVSFISAEQQPRPEFTQLWILPVSKGSSMENVVRLGINNREAETVKYRLVVNVNGKMVKQWTSINLSSGEQWVNTVALPGTSQSGTSRVEALLYRAQAPTIIYRNVVLWLGT